MSSNDARPTCELCGEPMPPGEEMFKFHGYSGPCPKPPKPAAALVVPAPMASQADLTQRFYSEGVKLLLRHDAKARAANFSGCGCEDCAWVRPLVVQAEAQASQPPASDSPASRSMGWVEAQKLADEALRLTEGTSPEPWAFNGYSKLTANLDFDAWSALDDQVGFRPDASEDASAYAAWRDRNKAAYDADPDVAYVPAEYGDTATGRHAKDAVFMEHARTQWPALARLVKSLPPPPGQEAPATSPQDSRFANPKSEISPLAFVPHGEPCTLAECPPGPFVHEDTLAIKAWYGGCGWVFVDESGTELFGGTDTVEQKLQLTVQPVRPAPVSSSASHSPELIAEAVEAIELAQSTLAMLTDPVYIRATSVITAWAQCLRAEVKARAILPKLKAQPVQTQAGGVGEWRFHDEGEKVGWVEVPGVGTFAMAGDEWRHHARKLVEIHNASIKAQQQPATPSTSPTLREAWTCRLCCRENIAEHDTCQHDIDDGVRCAGKKPALAQQAPSIQTPDTKGDSDANR